MLFVVFKCHFSPFLAMALVFFTLYRGVDGTFNGMFNEFSKLNRILCCVATSQEKRMW